MLQFDTDSTICAVATGDADALRGAVRITGPDTIEVLGRICRSIPALKSATRWETSIFDSVLGEIPVQIYCWPNERSYTGQPSAEIHSLGSPILLKQIQQQLLDSGAKFAQPGEFTLRAFLAGRLDLTQCEAVLGVIHANNEKSLQVALHQLAGGLTEPLHQTRRELINLLADIEAGLDFVDEDISFISQEQILNRLESAKLQIEKLLDQMHARASQSVAFQVALVGEPNAGKSSLLNAISDSAVAIVSETPGTTRDFLRYRMESDGVTIDLLDTAGLEQWDDQSPRGLAQAFTREQMAQADLILHCVPHDSDSSDTNTAVPFPNQSPSEPEFPQGKKVWQIRTKSDLSVSQTELRVENFQSHVSHYSSHHNPHSHPPLPDSFDVSSVTGDGLAELQKSLIHWAKTEREGQADAVPMTVERCRGSLSNALLAIDEAWDATMICRGDEIIAGELRIALDEIGLVTGTIYNDDILDALFSRFCIGK